MAATTESDTFMLSTQYLMEPFGYFLQDQFEEFEKRLFLDNDLDWFSALASSSSNEGMMIHKNSPEKAEKVEDDMNKNNMYMPTSPSLSGVSRRSLSFSAVSEELNSLSIQLPSPTNTTSPKKQRPPPLADSKEGILKDLYVNGMDDLSAMGLVFSGVGDDPSSRPYAMHRSHSLGQLRTTNNSTLHASSALDSTMQGLHACSGSIVPALTQLLEVKEDQAEMSSPSTSSNIRRVCSTGDLQRMNSEAQDEGGFKIGRYSLAERKERIHRYRQKRSERNFNKKIKYACRKTLADSRPRVRGRFAKNEDVVDSPSAFRVQQSKLRIAECGEFEEEVDVLLEDDESLFIDRQSSGELSESWRVRAG